MPTVAVRKEHPLSMRLPSADIALIDRAAQIKGTSRTEFMRQAAVREAEFVLMENTPIHLSPKDFATFMDILSGPATRVPEMVEIMTRPAPWESGYQERT